jgi:hypothetical protein
MCDKVTAGRRAAGQPRWIGLYAVTLPQLVALALVEIAGPPGVRSVARCLFALGTFVGIGWWVHASRGALDLQQWCECAPATITVRLIESRRPALSDRSVPAMPIRPKVDQDTLVGV